MSTFFKSWRALITKEPEPNPEYPTDPQDWTAQLELADAGGTIHETIYVTFTGTIGDDDAVIMTPEEVVQERIAAMLKGLNA